MKERPILLSGPMVRAILEGRKTMTRRVVKLRHGADVVVVNGQVWKPARVDYAGYVDCPYGQPGDRLWVRETLRAKDGFMVYAADDGRIDCDGLDWPACIEPRKTIVSIHMPRWASRLTLEITGVRVERLQGISAADAQAEGLDFVPDGAAAHGIKGLATSWSNDPRKSYRALWESINGPGSWEANPWVWVVEFKLVGNGGVA